MKDVRESEEAVERRGLGEDAGKVEMRILRGGRGEQERERERERTKRKGGREDEGQLSSKSLEDPEFPRVLRTNLDA